MANKETGNKEAILRGSKIRIYPTKRQARLIDLWRRRTISLWNLLLELEQAAYSGEKLRPRLHWRKHLVDIAQTNYKRDMLVWDNGRSGKRARKSGPEQLKDYALEKASYEAALKEWDSAEKAARGPKPKEPKKPAPPTPPAADWTTKILNGRDGTVYFEEPGESGVMPEKCYQPRLFIWKRELFALMARLKQEDHTKWIADLPSHAAQAVCKDLVQALEAMLRERRKKASGLGGRDTGFPKFKKTRHGSGSVYFANTQMEFKFENQRVRLSNGCGWMDCELPRQLRAEALKSGSKVELLGGRIWQQGDHWYLSCQWGLGKPDALVATGRTAGVKIGANVLITTYDDRGQTKEYITPPPDENLQKSYRRAGQRLSRALEAHKAKEKKRRSSGYSQRRKERLAKSGTGSGTGKEDTPLRLKRTQKFFQAADAVAGCQARERDQRDGFIHRVTTELVQNFDAIAVQRFQVAGLMEKESTKARRRAARRKNVDAAAAQENAINENAAKEDTRKRPMKQVRKLMRHAAMARCGQLLAYKFKDGRGEASYKEIDKFEANVIVCSGCGQDHYEWRVRPTNVVRCECGTVLPRNRNAARVSKKELDAHRKQKTEAEA